MMTMFLSGTMKKGVSRKRTTEIKDGNTLKAPIFSTILLLTTH